MAASTSAAVVTNNQVRLPDTAKTSDPSAATARLASTCHAFRPSLRSATPKTCFRRYPKRVEIHVSKNNAARIANAAGPAPTKSRRHAAPPANIPDRSTPRSARANIEKPIVTAPATASRSGDDAQPYARNNFSIQNLEVK